MDISPKLIDLRQKIESLSIDSNAKDSLISQLDSVSTLVEEKNRRMAIEESYVKLITDNINEVIFVIDLADLRFSYVSSSVYRLVGYFPEDLVGQSIMPFLTESSREYVKQITKERVAYFKIDPHKRHTYIDQFEQLHKNGSAISTETTSYFRLNRETGHPEIVAVSRDISRRKANEKLLTDRNKEIELLLNGSRMVLETKDFITTARQIFEYSRELTGARAGYIALLDENNEENDVLFLEAGGLPCGVDASLSMPIRGLRKVVYDTGQTTYDNNYEDSPHSKYMPPGHIPLHNVMFAPLKIGGKTIGLLGLGEKDGPFTDYDARIATSFAELVSIALQNSNNLDKLQHQEEQLRKTNHQKDLFISILAHDLRSPFNILIGLSRVLASNMEEFSTEELKDNLSTINSTTIQANDLLEQMLLWGNSQLGKLVLSPVELSFTDETNELIKLQENQAGLKGIKIVVDQKPINLTADLNMFKTIMRNLISNAIKFTKRDGEVKVYADQNSEGTTITVSDNGIGMEEDKIAQLWNSETLQTTRGTENEKGAGIGLMLCKELVEMHGGKIWVESRVGKGSDFKFTIPQREILIS